VSDPVAHSFPLIIPLDIIQRGSISLICPPKNQKKMSHGARVNLKNGNISDPMALPNNNTQGLWSNAKMRIHILTTLEVNRHA